MDKHESGKKQKRLGPAPIASFEDISDEMENVSSPESRLPDIKEDQTTIATTARPSTISTGIGSNILNPKTLGLHTPSTPRIDISRASSSSQHEDSRDSSPENVFDQVGTGTLQECLGGFREDGTMDLRSSTEELYFLENEERRENGNKNETRDQVSQLPQNQSTRRSPISFKFDEHQSQLAFMQHQRKDSASSEVAALLSISGRTSRISSVGSQGSAVSRLSAISGISRSPSPHRMLLETSFCGPKPMVDSICDGSLISGDESPAETLEHVLLSRKHDPTQAVLAEGIKIDFNGSPKKMHKAANGIESTAKRKTSTTLQKNSDVNVDIVVKPMPTSNRSRSNINSSNSGIGQTRKGIVKKYDSPKSVVGVTPSGTEYIRIKLKPDHMYEDKGLANNERVLDEPLEEVLKKPITLNLNKKTSGVDPEKISRYPDITTLATTPQSGLIKSQASPKPVRHIVLSRDQGSRSPSPATITVSRKSSFCSLFKSKDTIASPDSPRDRSRSKSRERCSSGGGSDFVITSTPNKQKSVLAIFKPGCRKLSGSKSKSTSPVDPSDQQITSSLLPSSQELSDGHNLAQVEFRFEPSQSCAIFDQSSSTPSSGRTSRTRLRYYDTPLDGNVIHIPLHTPPEEKGVFINEQINGVANKRDDLENVERIDLTDLSVRQTKTSSNKIPSILNSENIIATKQKPKVYRFENPDGSITIPLHSPPSNETEKILCSSIQTQKQPTPVDNKSDMDTSNWSIEVQRHSSLESQETVISTSQRQRNLSSSSNNSIIALNSNPQTPTVISSSSTQNQITNNSTPTAINVKKNNKLEKIIINNTNVNQLNSNNVNKITPAPPPPTPASATRDKKHILFSTKIGSGSEEQIFSTQFSLSKTESLSSQISENTTIFDSPTQQGMHDQPKEFNQSQTIFSEDVSNALDQQKFVSFEQQLCNETGDGNVSSGTNNVIVLRQKKPITLQEELSSAVELYQEKKSRDDYFNANRHSRYIENIDEIMEAQKKLTDSLSKTKRGDDYSEEGSPVIDHHQQNSPTKTTNSQTTITSNFNSAIGTTASTTPKISTDKINQIKEKRQSSSINTPTASSDYHGSSESEKESETESSTSNLSSRQTTKSRTSHPHQHHHHHPRNLNSSVDDHESTGLVSQQSFEEDLPYIPTTLPEERSMGVSLIPIKERAYMEIKMCPVDRPRSTTPINPASLEEYCGSMTIGDEGDSLQIRGEKLRICLPRRNSKERDLKINTSTPSTGSSSGLPSKSPRRISNSSQKSWFDFAVEQSGGVPSVISKQLTTQTNLEKDSDDQPPPPLPPRKPLSSSSNTSITTTSTQQWINFEEIPEKKKMPKKITTIPLKDHSQPTQSHHQHSVQYSYVNPEDCQCECHENERTLVISSNIQDDLLLEAKQEQNNQQPPEDVQPLLEADHSDCVDRTSDSSVDYSYGDCHIITLANRQHQDSTEMNLDRPFGMDLSVNQTCSSNRSSVVSQEPQSPQDDSTKLNIRHHNNKHSTENNKNISSHH